MPEGNRSQLRAARPVSRLDGFRGVLQVDGYAGFEQLTTRGEVVLAAGWAHTRRKFYEVHQATGSPIAAEALRRIAQVYAIEDAIRGKSAEERRRIRNTQSRPLIDAMKPWLELETSRIPPGGGLAEAIRPEHLCPAWDRAFRLHHLALPTQTREDPRPRSFAAYLGLVLLLPHKRRIVGGRSEQLAHEQLSRRKARAQW